MATFIVVFGLLAFVSLVGLYICADIRSELRYEKELSEYLEKINGCHCRHKLTGEECIVIGLVIDPYNKRYNIQVRCKDEKVKNFAHSEIAIYKNNEINDDGYNNDEDRPSHKDVTQSEINLPSNWN